MIVVGAGVLCTALALGLQRRGQAVELVDRERPGVGTSFGNLACIAVSAFMPLARPSVWRRAPGWPIDPEGPFRVAPQHQARLLPWVAPFVRAGSRRGATRWRTRVWR